MFKIVLTDVELLKNTIPIIAEIIDEGVFKVDKHGTGVSQNPLLDIKDEKPPVDQLNFPGRIEIESAVVEDGIADADIVGDSVIFEATPEFFRIYSKGDVSSTELEMAKKDSAMLKLQATGSLRARYPLEYLK